MKAKFPLIWIPMAVLAALLSAAGLLYLPLCVIVPLIGLPILLILPVFSRKYVDGRRMRGCLYGNLCLRAFCLSVPVTVAVQIGAMVCFFPNRRYGELIASLVVAILVEALLFWIGIIAVYCTSGKVGVKLRVIGILCGLIPIVHLFVLAEILRRTTVEIVSEHETLLRRRERAGQEICRTHYPILLVHGVFFRDTHFFNYWGRIPKALEENGAQLYYGNHASAASVEACGDELAGRIRAIVEETGCGKVNVIAHSKGGLDCRYAIAKGGVSHLVASLTTVNTPHHGCTFADWLLSSVPESFKNRVATGYNGVLSRLGDKNPDFIAAVTDLTADSCKKRNQALSDAEAGLYYSVPGKPTANAVEKASESGEGEPMIPAGDDPAASSDGGKIFRQSIGSVMHKPAGGVFPLNLTYRLAGYFEGPNDGLVSESSCRWEGCRHTALLPKGKRGISHGDVIDLCRVDADGFDVREFYIKLVSEMKEMGL
ncbi:MAG: lipase family alpha/beta hydrolase [Eubacteriales bacterium]